MPDMCHVHVGFAAVVHNDKIYAVGGWGGAPCLEVFDPVENSWTSLGEVRDRRAFGGAVIGDCILIMPPSPLKRHDNPN
jgi:hypothetical protein